MVRLTSHTSCANPSVSGVSWCLGHTYVSFIDSPEGGQGFRVLDTYQIRFRYVSDTFQIRFRYVTNLEIILPRIQGIEYAHFQFIIENIELYN